MANQELSIVVVCQATESLGDEERHELAQALAQEMRELDGVQRSGLVTDTSSGHGRKSGLGYVIGAAQALVSAGALTLLIDYLKQRLGQQPIELTVSAGAEAITIKASSRADFERALTEVHRLIRERPAKTEHD